MPVEIRKALLRSRMRISRSATSQTLAAIGRASGGACGAHWMTSLKIWARVGCCGAKLATSPCATARRSTRWAASRRVDVEDGVAAVEVEHRRRPARRAASRRRRRAQLVAAGGVLGAQRLARAGGADRAVGDDHEVVAEPLDDVELVRREQHGRAGGGAVLAARRRTTSTASGSRPENGSSRMSTSGSCTSAAAICARCWLPSESVSTLSPARSPSPSRSSSASVLRRRGAGARGRAVARGRRSARAPSSSGRARAPRACSRSGGGRSRPSSRRRA